ncbi:MAG: type II toxin-antitoxin system VapC family toxin [Phycisphaerales bacterium]
MKPVFADTYYLLALLNPRDEGHAAAIEIHANSDRPMVTTAWVVVELLDAMSNPRRRARAAAFVRDLLDSERVELIDAPGAFWSGVQLFERRRDKDWSLTDGISFVVMKSRGLREALTADHHFVQAGFGVLLK